jgi:hypothetical protein
MCANFVNGNVAAACDGCDGAISTFEYRNANGEFGQHSIERAHGFQGHQYARVVYRLLRCAGCGKGGLAKVHVARDYLQGKLESFYPVAIEHAALPPGMPDGIVAEMREAELCASSGAWRGASGLLRSTLEKLLRANGYEKGTLAARIDQAAADHVITEARRRRAHEDVRVLGNDVLHDEWREVTPEEVDVAHHYVQRIAEDLYDDRASVEALLRAAGRIP